MYLEMRSSLQKYCVYVTGGSLLASVEFRERKEGLVVHTFIKNIFQGRNGPVDRACGLLQG